MKIAWKHLSGGRTLPLTTKMFLDSGGNVWKAGCSELDGYVFCRVVDWDFKHEIVAYSEDNYSLYLYAKAKEAIKLWK